MAILLKQSEAAAVLGVHEATLLRWRRQGCPCRLVNTALRPRFRYDLEDVRRWVQEETHKRGLRRRGYLAGKEGKV